MFSSLKNFVSRHRRKFVVTGVVVGGTVLALRYAQRKIIEYQQEQTRQFIERTKRSQHFESTERTCNQAIIGVATTMCQELQTKLDAEPILEQLRQKPDNKKELWQDLKILAFTRLTTLVYACSMLVVALRIQLNVLGGYLYKDTKLTKPRVSNDIQQKYLSLSQHLLNDGLDKLSQLIDIKVRQVLSGYDLKQQITLADTEQIFWSIQMAVNADAADPNSKMSEYVFPITTDNCNNIIISNNTTSQNENVYDTMYTETLDMFESDETSSLCASNVSRGFAIVMDNIADFYGSSGGLLIENNNMNGSVSSSSSSSSTIIAATKSDLNAVTNINTVRMPLAKLIPVINGLASKVFDNNGRPPSLSTSLITLFMISEKVKLLGANVYEVFSQ